MNIRLTERGGYSLNFEMSKLERFQSLPKPQFGIV